MSSILQLYDEISEIWLLSLLAFEATEAAAEASAVAVAIEIIYS